MYFKEEYITDVLSGFRISSLYTVPDLQTPSAGVVLFLHTQTPL
jgi:hypothetical protein